MALRSPIYLDTETLLAQAEYHDVDVPRQAEIVEKSVQKRSAGGKLGVSNVGINASAGTDVEYQSTYKLEPREKATVSRVIDKLVRQEAIKLNPDGDTPLSKDDLVEVEGLTRITAASLAGKLLFIMRRVMGTSDEAVEEMFDMEATDAPVMEQLKQVYLRNELLPVPILLQLTGSDLPQKVYINVRPDHFVDAASSNRIEGNLRVLGTVSRLVDNGDEGFLSAEEWLLHDWEYLMRRQMMTQVGDRVKELVDQMGLNFPSEDVHAHIAGPAIVIDAIALY